VSEKKKVVPKHVHSPSDIIESPDDQLLAEWRLKEDPSKPKIDSLKSIPDEFFPAASEGRAKFEPEFVDELLVEDDAITTLKIKDLSITNDKISNLEVDRITADRIYSGLVQTKRLSADHLRTDTAIITKYAQVAKLDADIIDAGYLNAARLDTAVAYISETAMIADLKVTTGKLAEMMGIKSAEIPVIDPNEYSRGCVAIKGQGAETCDWADLGKTFSFNAYSYIKHALTKVTVETKVTWNAYVIGGHVYLRCYISDDGGESWTQFGSEIAWIDVEQTSWTIKTFTDNYLSPTLNKSFKAKLTCKLTNDGSVEGNALITLYVKNFELTERAFRSQRSDI